MSENQEIALNEGDPPSGVEGEVAAAGAAAAAVAGEQPQSTGESFLAITKSLIMRALIIYAITSFFRRPKPTPTLDEQNNPIAPIAANNVFTEGMLFDLYVYVNEEEFFTQFDDRETLVWAKEDLVYGDWTSGVEEDGTYKNIFKFNPSKNVMNNGSVYIHTFAVKSGFSPNPHSDEGMYNQNYTLQASQLLNKYKKRRYQKRTNLITGESQLTQEEMEKAALKKVDIISYWHPNITVNIVHDFTQWTRGIVPAPMDQFIEFSSNGKEYKPVLFLNTYWNLIRDYQPINETTNELEICVTFQPITLTKWLLYAAQTMRNKFPAANFLDGMNPEDDDDEDKDAMKETFLETSPYLLALTVAVSILHSIFEFLAFKNDIQFWNNRQSLEGLSVKFVFFNVFQSLIVLLYVLDNETNFVIKVSCFAGLGIEMWKITKVMDVSLNREKTILGFPTLKFEDKSTYVESSTKQYDDLAFRYLGMALFPLLGGYCVYSLFYQEHKGWYSFVLSMLYGFLLTFGFIMMTPQLFINYKLKSVAHLPWRMLTYKSLNTFIDDIFAFVIKMPTMYRIGCLRDDVVFFIFLYQRYIYRVDPSRLNEFGFSQEMEQEARQKKLQAPNQVPEIESSNEESEAEPKSIEDKKKD